jgi:hypothetical protein
MEPFTINENIIDEEEYFIFDDVSSSSLEDNDVSYVDSEGEESSVVVPSHQQVVQQPTIIPIVTPSSALFTPTTVQSLFIESHKTPLVAYLKPAKGRDDHYTVGDFPVSLLCNPYKYDLKLVGDIHPGKANSPTSALKSISDLLNQQRAVMDESEFLCVTLVDADTMAAPTICATTTTGANISQAPLKKGNVSVESITPVNSKERVIRFTFNLCSFHVKRRAFRLVVTNKNTGENVFVSSPFKTFARKRDRTGNSASNGPMMQQHKVAAMPNMYFMNQQAADKKKARSVRATPYPVVSKMNRYSPTMQVTSPELAEMHQNQQYPQMPVFTPMSGYGMYPHNAFHTGYTYPIENLLQNLGPQERTSLAIQLMSSLTPVERETVDFYLSCSGQCFAMNPTNKSEQVNPCFVATQPHANSRV